ncbi:MAG: ribosome silencing factor [Clostridia bacterium]|nr:ribosome silencing factor [Clostridia bacterium]
MNKKIETAAQAALSKKAHEVTRLHVSEMTVVADDFLICSGSSKTQVRAISDAVEEEMKKQGHEALRVDGYQEARWIVLDYGDLLVHIFDDEDRLFFNLERLWSNGNNADIIAD